MPESETNKEIKYDQSLDTKGLNCPLPVLRAKLALNKMQPGQILHVEATDPLSTIDFEAYCARTGHQIIRMTDAGGVIEFYICRAENPRKI